MHCQYYSSATTLAEGAARVASVFNIYVSHNNDSKWNGNPSNTRRRERARNLWAMTHVGKKEDWGVPGALFTSENLGALVSRKNNNGLTPSGTPILPTKKKLERAV